MKIKEKADNRINVLPQFYDEKWLTKLEKYGIKELIRKSYLSILFDLYSKKSKLKFLSEKSKKELKIISIKN